MFTSGFETYFDFDLIEKQKLRVEEKSNRFFAKMVQGKSFVYFSIRVNLNISMN